MKFGNNWLSKLNYKFGKYAIHNIMAFIIVGMGTVFILDIISPISVIRLLAFDKAGIAHGEIWRLFSFIFIPPDSSYLFIILSLYFYWLMGSSLENEWGAFKFNIFYLCGMVGTIIAGILTGYATNYYINMSLFFAFAMLYPNHEILLFFFVPVKIKYLAYINAAYFLYMFIMSSWVGKIALLVSILNILVFFGGDFLDSIKQQYRRAKWKRNFRR